MRSPIITLKNAIAGSAFRIAPEMERELALWRDQSGVSLVLSDDVGFNVYVDLDTKEVTIPVASLEFLWAAAHGFYVFYQEYMQGQQAGQKQFDIAALPRTADAWRLLEWALRNVRASGLPTPVQFPADGSDIHVANELFLCAIAWIIHHEFAHLRLNHTTESMSPQRQEREADAAATDWILSESKVDQETKKRILGIATAILSLQILEKPGARAADRSHPLAVERLSNCLAKAGCEGDHEVFPWAIIAMQIILAKHELYCSAPDGESFEEMLSHLMLAYFRGECP